MPEGVDAWLGEAQTGGTLAGPFDRTIDLLKGVWRECSRN
jgi:hypothetical protein